MKLLRTFVIAVGVLVPVLAVAAPRKAACCDHCPICAFCPHC